MGKDIFCIIITALPIVIPIVVFFIITIKENCPTGNYPTISFNQFIALYRINPERWKLETNYVQYSCSSYKLINQKGFWLTGYKIIEFATIIDCFKYKRWVKKESKRKEDIKRNKEMTELLAEWQKDINEAQKANVQRTKELMKKNEEDAKKYGGK